MRTNRRLIAEMREMGLHPEPAPRDDVAHLLRTVRRAAGARFGSRPKEVLIRGKEIVLVVDFEEGGGLRVLDVQKTPQGFSFREAA